MKELNTFIKLPSLRMFTFDKAHIAFHRINFACKLDLHNAFGTSLFTKHSKDI